MNVQVNPILDEVVDAIQELHKLDDKEAFVEKAMSYSDDTKVYFITKGLLLTLLELEFDVTAAEVWEIFAENSI